MWMNALYNTSGILISFWMKEFRIFIFVLWLTFILTVSFMKLGNSRALWNCSKAFCFYLQLSDCLLTKEQWVRKGNWLLTTLLQFPHHKEGCAYIAMGCTLFDFVLCCGSKRPQISLTFFQKANLPSVPKEWKRSSVR